jgi:hypothetical protein
VGYAVQCSAVRARYRWLPKRVGGRKIATLSESVSSPIASLGFRIGKPGAAILRATSCAQQRSGGGPLLTADLSGLPALWTVLPWRFWRSRHAYGQRSDVGF